MSTAPEQAATATATAQSNVNLLELNETVSRLISHKGVEVVQVLNKAGDIITESRPTTTSTTTAHSTLPQHEAADDNAATAATNTSSPTSSTEESNDSGAVSNKHPHQAALVKKLLHVATTYLQSLEEDDEVAFLQVRSAGGRELMIAPHQGYALVVLKRV
jgi:hypothetical protein